MLYSFIQPFLSLFTYFLQDPNIYPENMVSLFVFIMFSIVFVPFISLAFFRFFFSLFHR